MRIARLLIVATGVGLAVTLPSAAWAAPSPSSGPTEGGTVVSDSLPAPVTFTEMSTGVYFSQAVDSSGIAWAWGANDLGQVGDGTTADRDLPVQIAVPDGVKFTRMDAGARFSLAAGSDGETYAWGDDSTGQLGDGRTSSQPTPTPGRVLAPAGVTFTTFAAGYNHALAVGSDGAVYAWGWNSYGQLGDGTTVDHSVPVKVDTPAGVTFSEVAAGELTSFALATDGSVYAWGANFQGQAGTGGGTGNVLTPTKVAFPGGARIARLAAHANHTLALTADGQLYGWGSNTFGQVGDGTTTDRGTPVPVSTPAGLSITAIQTGIFHSAFLTADGHAYTWGANFSGQLGDGTTAGHATPERVHAPAGVRFASISAGANHTLATGSDTLTYAWGGNGYGQLGDGTRENQPLPRPIDSTPTIVRVTFGGNEATSLTQTGSTWTATAPAGCGIHDVTATYTLFGTEHSLTTPDGFTQGTLPTVTKQPRDTTVTLGGRATVTADADGDDTPTVRWEQAPTPAGPWSPIADQTSPTLELAPTEDTTVRAVFTNCRGQVTTDAATIAVSSSTVPPVTPDGDKGTARPAAPNTDGDGDLASTGSQAPVALFFGALAALLVGAAAVLRNRIVRPRHRTER